MSLKNILKKPVSASVISIGLGTLAGLISVYVCIFFNLSIYGFNIFLIISPIIAGFVETKVSKDLTNKTTGAISSIILFIVTNVIGWIFPANPIKWNIFTVGGLIVMLQAAFPLTINYVLLGLMFVFVFILGRIGLIFETILRRRNRKITLDDMEFDESNSDILILTNQPNIPIKEYKGLIFAENVVDFDEKNRQEVVTYLSSNYSQKQLLKQHDYILARRYILQQLKSKAKQIGANAIIDIEIEYTNYNQQLPPDMLMSVYGTAVVISEKYLHNK